MLILTRKGTVFAKVMVVPKPIDMKNLRYPAIILCSIITSCGQPEPNQTSQTATPPAEDTIAQMPGGGPRPNSSTNEQLFRTALSSFRTAATAGDYATLGKMIRFPLQTAPKWSRDNVPTTDSDSAAGQVSEMQFARFRDKIFTPDVKAELEKEIQSEIREIPAGAEDDYYRRLFPGVDSAAPLYEVYHPYIDKSRNAESWFAFIFGKVGTTYKVTGFHSKWPVQ